MRKTYRAMQVTRPGELDLVERAAPEPGASEAYRRMRSGQSRLRMVLTMENAA